MITPQKTADILSIFNAQGAMKLIGARLTEVDEGVAEFEVDFRPELSQQHGYFHAGVIGTLVDTAGSRRNHQVRAHTNHHAGQSICDEERGGDALRIDAADVDFYTGKVDFHWQGS